jgi:hypothetical protein
MILPPPVFAYVDPGSGSYLLQVFIAGVAAASLSLKLFWTRIKAFLSGPSVDEESSHSQDGTAAGKQDGRREESRLV